MSKLLIMMGGKNKSIVSKKKGVISSLISEEREKFGEAFENSEFIEENQEGSAYFHNI